MPNSPDMLSLRNRAPVAPRTVNGLSLVLTCLLIIAIPAALRAQAAAGLLSSREEISTAASDAERSGRTLDAAELRQRLRDGDFQVGDRILLTIVSDVRRTDTLVVQAGRQVDLPGLTVVPLTGVLRSELKDKITTAALKYVKAAEIDVAPLTRIAVLGEVTRPGYFAVHSDIAVTDAIMLAGGLTGSADIDRSVVRRAGRELRSESETRRAVSKGLTLDQFGINAGDEFVVGRRRQVINQSTTAIVGMIASLGALFFAVRH